MGRESVRDNRRRRRREVGKEDKRDGDVVIKIRDIGKTEKEEICNETKYKEYVIRIERVRANKNIFSLFYICFI